MKINKIIFSSDDSDFLDFWPLQSKICREILNIEPVLFRITDEDSDFYNDEYGLVKNVKKIKGINNGALAAIGRMFFTKYFQDEVCVVSDIDMIIINKDYLQNSIRDFHEDSLVIYISDAYDVNRPEAKEYVSRDYFEKNIGQLYPYYLNAAKGKTFDSILNTNCTFEEYINRHKLLGNKTLFWGVDECYFSKCVNSNQHQVKVEKLKRGYQSPWICTNRIERHRFPVKLSFQNEIDRQKIDGVYNFNDIVKDSIYEINLPRPYKSYKNDIDIIINKILSIKSKMKKIALISTFCDTEHKKNILHENVEKIKKLGIDVMLISPNFIEIPYKTIAISDFCFYTKENPLLNWPVRSFTHWYEMPIDDDRSTTLHRNFSDYGWAALYQSKKLSQIALTFDYDIFYHLIYDLEIDEVVESEFLSNEVNLIHPRRDPHHPEHLWETTLHFMVFDRKMMEDIESEIRLEEYLRTNGVAEGEVLKWTKKYDIKISEHPIKDKVYYWENVDFFNLSPFEDFKMFLSKNEETEVWLGYENKYKEKLSQNLKIVFYSFTNINPVQIIVNDVKYELTPEKWKINEFPVSSQEIQTIKFIYNGVEVDYTKNYGDIMRNQIYYNYRKR